jgi:hypothetical protein
MPDYQVNEILVNRLRDQWMNRTEIAWDNVKFTPKRGEAFIRYTLDCYDSDAINIQCQKLYYLLTLQVFTPTSEGPDESLVLSEYLRDIFVGFRVDKLTVVNIRSERVGEEEEYYQRQVLIDLTFYEFV